MTQLAIKPSQINTKGQFGGTVWQKFEKETVARNIVIISREGGDEWSPFTFTEYKERCSHTVTWSELEVLEELVNGGYLHKENDHYEVTNSFIAALAEYVR